MFTADFETIVDPIETRLWAWSSCQIGNIDNVKFGNSDESFMEWVYSFKKSTKIYFHNLKFDGEFLFYIFNKHGLKYYNIKSQEESRSIPEGHYSTLINAEGSQWYSIKLCIKRKGKRVINIEFLDSSKIIPSSVEEIAINFDLPMKKGEIDYLAFREIGHELTKDEIDYIKKDVQIMSLALEQMFNINLKRMTIGSNAMFNFKESLHSKSQYNYLFPVLPYDRDLRQSYRGGWVYCNPEIKGKNIEKGISLDVNSLYPWAMYDNPLPIGEGIPFKGEYVQDDLYPLYIMQVQLNFKIKENHLPAIQIKDSIFAEREWLTDSKYYYPVLCITSVDWELIKDHYDLFNVDIIGGWKFKSSRDIFKPYIDHWMGEKIKASKEKNKSKRTIAKLMLNSLYGKFGSKPYTRQKEPYFDYDGLLYFKRTALMDKDPVYVPMASFITSYAREKTIRTAQKLYDRFLYSDTDSIHLSGWELPEIELDDFELGAWAFENKFIRARFLGPKCYLEDLVNEDGNIKKSVTVAGLPEKLHDQVTWENFQVGATYKGKLMPKSIKGGVYLEETDYIIRSR